MRGQKFLRILGLLVIVTTLQLFIFGIFGLRKEVPIEVRNFNSELSVQRVLKRTKLCSHYFEDLHNLMLPNNDTIVNK